MDYWKEALIEANLPSTVAVSIVDEYIVCCFSLTCDIFIFRLEKLHYPCLFAHHSQGAASVSTETSPPGHDVATPTVPTDKGSGVNPIESAPGLDTADISVTTVRVIKNYHFIMT